MSNNDVSDDSEDEGTAVPDFPNEPPAPKGWTASLTFNNPFQAPKESNWAQRQAEVSLFECLRSGEMRALHVL